MDFSYVWDRWRETFWKTWDYSNTITSLVEIFRNLLLTLHQNLRKESRMETFLRFLNSYWNITHISLTLSSIPQISHRPTKGQTIFEKSYSPYHMECVFFCKNECEPMILENFIDTDLLAFSKCLIKRYYQTNGKNAPYLCEKINK